MPLLNRCRVSVSHDKCVLGLGGGDGCPECKCIHHDWAARVEMVRMVNFLWCFCLVFQRSLENLMGVFGVQTEQYGKCPRWGMTECGV